MKLLYTIIMFLFLSLQVEAQTIVPRIADAGTMGSNSDADFELIFTASEAQPNSNWAAGFIFIKIADGELEAGNDVVLLNPSSSFRWGRCNLVSGPDFSTEGFSYFIFCYDGTPQNFSTTFQTGVDVLQAEFQVTGPTAARGEFNTRAVAEVCVVGDADAGVAFAGTPYGTGISTTDNINLLSAPDPSCLQLGAAAPIYLSGFDARKIDQNTVQLDWTSVLEINSSHFEVERTTDGEDWTYLGTVNAAGESSLEIDYSYIDREVNLKRNETKIYYYRLKQVDLDGFTEYSEIKGVRMEGRGYEDISYFPNPTSDFLNIDIASDIEAGDVRYQIHDVTGKKIVDQVVDIEVQRLHTVNLRDKGIDSGVYMVRVLHNSEVISASKVVLVD